MAVGARRRQLQGAEAGEVAGGAAINDIIVEPGPIFGWSWDPFLGGAEVKNNATVPSQGAFNGH